MKKIEAWLHPNSPNWPTGLKTPVEMANILHIKKERLLDFADKGYIPHYRIDDNEIRFQTGECKKWARSNIVYKEKGKKLPEKFQVDVTEPLTEIPQALANVVGIQKISRNNYTCGVYFLVYEKEIIYIGQSHCPINRITGHLIDKKFDSVYFVSCPSDLLLNLEGALIRFFKPKANINNAQGDKSADEFLLKTYNFVS